MSSLERGIFVGRYELVSRIGTGGMGEVFLARAVGAGGFAKEVVIKRILPHLASDDGFVQRFIEEGKLVVRLRHAGIAQVLDMGQDGGVFFIAMEHVEGKDLGELMRVANAAGLRMPVALVAHVLAALLDALDYAHNAKDAEGRPLGIIHRDVSPSNVMVSTTGEVKLLDFGIARATERLQASTTGAIRGKYSYMSPQQAGGAELDARSDLFSVGVIAWELLAGERPFDGSSDLLTLDRIRYHDPGRLRDKVPDLPEDVAAVVERLVAKQPEGRFASAHEAAQALRQYMLRSGKLATSKDLAAWFAEVQATLPRALRDRSMQGLSVDDLLRMSLGSDPRSDLGSSSQHTPSGLKDLRPQTVMVAPSSALVPAATTPPPAVTPPPAAPSPTPSKAGFPSLLVGLNLALIVLVVVLVMREDDPPPPLPTTSDATQVTAIEVTPEVAAPIAVSPEVVATAEVAPEVAPEVTVVAPAGELAGSVLAALDDEVFAGDLSLVVRAVPAGATVSVTGHGVGRAPRTIEARRGVTVSGRVTAPDHEARTFEVVMGESESITVKLEPLPRGGVQFKFFPADGTRVTINGKTLAVQSNVVATELPVGRHALVLETRDGRRLAKTFEVEEGKTTSLGTLEL